MIDWSLAAVSVVTGIIVVWVFQHTTDLVALRKTRKLLMAHLMEFRLFYNEPVLIWGAQKAVVRDNVRLLGIVLRPVAIMALPMAWMFAQLDSIYGFAPLPIGQPSVVSVQMSGAESLLTAPPQIAVETPPVRSLADNQVSWRIRPLKPVRGSLILHLRGAEITKSISAGERTIFLNPRRERSITAFLLHPEEAPITAPHVLWIEVQYPQTGYAWIAWFLGISSISAVLFARWLRIPL